MSNHTLIANDTPQKRVDPTPPSIEEPWLTTKGAARRANCSVPTILRAARSGRLRAARINCNKTYRFRPVWIDLWLEMATPEYAASQQNTRGVSR